MSLADQISLFSEHTNLPSFFCQKGEDLLPLFPNMLESLHNEYPLRGEIISV